MADDKPIIVIKKKGGHAAHHGGAWKVAFADFMTAMMCFFMVMWLVGTASEPTRERIAKYFRDPGVFETGSGAPFLEAGIGILDDAFVPPHPARERKHQGRGEDPMHERGGTDPDQETAGVTADAADGKAPTTAQGTTPSPSPSVAPTLIPPASETVGAQGGASGWEMQKFAELAEEIKKKIQQIPELKDILGDLEVKLEADGLVIEIMDTKERSMFTTSSAKILPAAQTAFVKIATLLQGFPNSIDVIGHTDSRPFSSRTGGYSNWDLSSDRANAARRLLESAGVQSGRVLSVVGRADKDLRNQKDPMNAENRRISLKMRFSSDATIPAGEAASALDELREFARQKSAPATAPSTGPVTPEEQSGASATPAKLKPTKRTPRRKTGIQLPESPATEELPPINQDQLFGDTPILLPSPLGGQF